MTNRDPYDNRVRSDAGMSTGAIAAAVIAAVLIIGGLFYAMSDRSSITATAPNTTNSQPSTTGQGGKAPAPSAPTQNAPAPSAPKQ